MVTGSLARRYAKAILALNDAKIATDLRALAKAMHDSAELVGSLTNPAIRKSDRRKVIDELLKRIGAGPLSKNTVNLLLDGERLASLPAISRELDAMIEAKSGRVSAEIVSARPLDASQVSQITAALEKASGKKVTVSKREDPELLGGVVAKIGDTVYDYSLRNQLRNLRDSLAKDV
jgi:F-type H+-transporting ATPase subunit delta